MEVPRLVEAPQVEAAPKAKPKAKGQPKAKGRRATGPGSRPKNRGFSSGFVLAQSGRTPLCCRRVFEAVPYGMLARLSAWPVLYVAALWRNF